MFSPFFIIFFLIGFPAFGWPIFLRGEIIDKVAISRLLAKNGGTSAGENYQAYSNPPQYVVDFVYHLQQAIRGKDIKKFWSIRQFFKVYSHFWQRGLGKIGNCTNEILVYNCVKLCSQRLPKMIEATQKGLISPKYKAPRKSFEIPSKNKAGGGFIFERGFACVRSTMSVVCCWP